MNYPVINHPSIPNLREQTLSKDVHEKPYMINREVLKEKYDVVITEPIEDTLKRPFDIIRSKSIIVSVKIANRYELSHN